MRQFGNSFSSIKIFLTVSVCLLNRNIWHKMFPDILIETCAIVLRSSFIMMQYISKLQPSSSPHPTPPHPKKVYSSVNSLIWQSLATCDNSVRIELKCYGKLNSLFKGVASQELLSQTWLVTTVLSRTALSISISTEHAAVQHSEDILLNAVVDLVLLIKYADVCPNSRPTKADSLGYGLQICMVTNLSNVLYVQWSSRISPGAALHPLLIYTPITKMWPNVLYLKHSLILPLFFSSSLVRFAFIILSSFFIFFKTCFESELS